MKKKEKLFLIFIFFLLSNSIILSKILEKIEVKERIDSFAGESANVIIITSVELKKLNIRTLSSLFSILPGISVARRGPGDTSFDLSMRGGNFEHVTVQIDGMPFNNSQTGHFNTDLPFGPDDIDRIVITKGGSIRGTPSGFSGTINIILKKNRNLKLSLIGGDKKFFNIHFSDGINLGGFHLMISSGRKTSSGFYKGNEFDILKILSNAGYSKKDFSADISFGNIKKDFGAKNFYAPYPSLENVNSWYSQFSIKKKLRKIFLNFSYMRNIHKDNFILDRYNRSFYMNSSTTIQDYLRLLGILKMNSLDFSSGIDFKYEKMDSSEMGVVKRRRGGLFLNLSINKKIWSSDCDLRIELLSGNRIEILYNMNFYRRLGEKFSIKLSMGKNIRFPSFTELYYNSPANRGDADLKNELSNNSQLSLNYFRKHSAFNFSLYYRDQKNLIDWVKFYGNSFWSAANISSFDIFGIEISHSLNFKKGGLRSSFERIFPLKTDVQPISKYGLRFPDILIKLQSYYKISDFMNLSFIYQFKRIFKSTEKGHFLDISFSIPIGNEKYSISLNADNIFNTIIEEIPGIKVPGRWVYISFSYVND